MYGMNVLYHLQCIRLETSSECTLLTRSKNAFEILMSAAKEKKSPHRKQGDQLNGYQKLRNAALEVFEAHGIAWSPQSVDTIGESYLSQVVAVLWYLDAHYEMLKERDQRLPKELAYLSGFNEWKRKK